MNDGREELVPLRTDFDAAWRGFDRRQVRHYVAAVEADLRLLAVDRDAAVARADDLARELERARAEIRELKERYDRVCRTPVEPDALSERLRRMLELAHAEADEVTSRARAAADQSWETTRRATERLRERHERLVADLDARRHEMETEHRDLLRRTRAQVDAMTREAEQRRRDLDAQAQRLRAQVEADFEVAMAARRAEALREVADQRAAARAHAERLVREAREQADRIVTAARAEADRLAARRADIASSLRDAERLLADLDPLLEPVPEEAEVVTHLAA
ncbi:coiled-coil domain-containing protein [Saccharothrix variisporea]|uniref:DivIVA protein n=1 Tax=Saccharothrix variisporea TaxID=543527 RepID=A0A495WZI5_9PSEU|nr:hypothetical protein [Saccharothrix variisporea]RKT67057.1 hypothetical protein DFJ66_0225 [Saccharothrix variisporea]